MATRDIIQAAAGVGGGSGPLYVEDLFSTYLYTGNGSAQSINNGIDLAGEGGMVWVKGRDFGTHHFVFDTARGVEKYLTTSMTQAENYNGGPPGYKTLGSFNSNGFTISGTGGGTTNASARLYTSWTLRKAPKFFDVVTYTGNGVWDTAIPHNLGSSPGFVIIKRTDTESNWVAQHRSNTEKNSKILYLNDSAAYSLEGDNFFSRSDCLTSTDVYIGANANVNANNGTYVMYLFAHDAGGFGADGTENVISCGSYTGNSSSNGPEINLGWEPQWLLVKSLTSAENWTIFDVMRGMPVGGSDVKLHPNIADAEVGFPYYNLTPTGFKVASTSGLVNGSHTYIYVAIRRGPMKVPESGTEVYNPLTRVGTGTDVTITANITPVDLVISKATGGGKNVSWWDRLRGRGNQIYSNSSAAEIYRATSLTGFDVQNGYKAGSDGDNLVINSSGESYVNWSFRRAPGFFDVVCYSGTGSSTPVPHNLKATPELIFLKSRSNAFNWLVLTPSLISAGEYLQLNGSDAATPNSNQGYNSWGASTATTITPGVNPAHTAGWTYVAYLFATLPGVSKVGTYTGTGTTNQIDCGFSGGARFVLIKRTDDAGNWYVWDSARGIVAGNDPYLWLNSTNAELTGDFIDPYSAGFEISSSAPAALNANGGTYLYLAIA